MGVPSPLTCLLLEFEESNLRLEPVQLVRRLFWHTYIKYKVHAKR